MNPSRGRIPTNESVATAVYGILLWLHPPAYRRSFRGEILQHVRIEAGQRPALTLMPMLVRDGVASLVREWTDTLRRRPGLRQPRHGEPMQNIWQDVRLALRMLRKSPAFTAAAVVTLALGIGANTAMFTLADATLLRPLPVRDPHQLVAWSWSSSYPHYVEYAKRTDLFQGVLAASGTSRMNLVVDGSAELARVTFLSGNAFDVLGVGAAHGRTLLPSDDVPNGPLVAVLNHEFWKNRFGGDVAVIGRTVRINARQVTIVGVSQKGFRGTSVAASPSLYLATTGYSQVATGFFSRRDPVKSSGFVWLTVIARLRPDVAVNDAAAAMDSLYTQLQPPRGGAREEKLRLEPMAQRALGGSAADVTSFVALLLGVVGLTLLIGCANLANLLLARATARRREMGVRLALGASRGRVIQQMLVESVLLALIGGLCGTGVAVVVLGALEQYQLPGGIGIGALGLYVDRAALAVTLALSVLTGLLFGLIPAWRSSRTDAIVSLREQSRSATARSAVRSSLLAAQVALCLVLLSGAGLFAKGLMSALSVPIGFVPDGVVTASLNLGLARYDESRAAQFYASALESVRALPQVTAAAWGNLIPTRGVFVGQAEVEGYQAGKGESVNVYGSHASAGFFRALGMQTIAGRTFEPGDTASSPPVAVVNEEMARKYWPGRPPLGGKVRMFDQWVTVVGVVGNTVVRELREQPVPQIYLVFEQWLTGPMGVATDTAHLFIKTSERADVVLPLVRDRLRTLDPELPLYDLAGLDERVASLVMPQRMGVTLFAFFSTLAVTLAAVGIYGVASYVSAMRRREIGVRLALGATTARIRRLVLIDGVVPIGLGMAVGLALALYASRLAGAFLSGISAWDPTTYAGVTLFLAVVAAFASYLPARRAARVDPVQALREE